MATQTASPGPKVNHIGLPVLEYRGGKSTLCAGCGHNAISERIIDAMFEMGVQPERVMKMSGIGCSSKSPAYFISRSQQLQLGARPHAVGFDGRTSSPITPRRAPGCFRRRRHGFNRYGPIRSLDGAVICR